MLLSFQNAAAPSPLGQMPPQDGMAGGPIPPSFFPVSKMWRKKYHSSSS